MSNIGITVQEYIKSLNKIEKINVKRDSILATVLRYILKRPLGSKISSEELMDIGCKYPASMFRRLEAIDVIVSERLRGQKITYHLSDKFKINFI
jgi:hypothetical protein